MHGFEVLLTPMNLGYMVVGILLGVMIGVLPGVGGANGIAILLPLTFSMPPTSAIIMLSAIYWGALFGGAISADPVQHPGRAVVGRDDLRRPSDGASRVAPAKR